MSGWLRAACGVDEVPDCYLTITTPWSLASKACVSKSKMVIPKVKGLAIYDKTSLYESVESYMVSLETDNGAGVGRYRRHRVKQFQIEHHSEYRLFQLYSQSPAKPCTTRTDL